MVKLPARFLEFLTFGLLMLFVGLLTADRYLQSKLLPVETWATIQPEKGCEGACSANASQLLAVH